MIKTIRSRERSCSLPSQDFTSLVQHADLKLAQTIPMSTFLSSLTLHVGCKLAYSSTWNEQRAITCSAHGDCAGQPRLQDKEIASANKESYKLHAGYWRNDRGRKATECIGEKLFHHQSQIILLPFLCTLFSEPKTRSARRSRVWTFPFVSPSRQLYLHL